MRCWTTRCSCTRAGSPPAMPAELAIYPGGAHGFTLFPERFVEGGGSEDGRLPQTRTRMKGQAEWNFRSAPQQREMIASVRELAQTEFKPNAHALDGRHVSLGEHEEAGRPWRARHVGAGGIRRPWPADPGHRADPGGNRQGRLRDRDGGAGRGRRANPGDRPLCSGIDPGAHSAARGQRRLHPRGVHDGAACRHRCRELPHQHAGVERPDHPERHQNPDQPRA